MIFLLRPRAAGTGELDEDFGMKAGIQFVGDVPIRLPC